MYFLRAHKQEMIASDMGKVSLAEDYPNTVVHAHNEFENDNRSSDSDATGTNALDINDIAEIADAQAQNNLSRSSNIDSHKKVKLLAALRAIDANEY